MKNESLFSRGSMSNPFGKCTDELATMVPFEIKQEFARKARDAGFANSSEYLREIVMVNVIGFDGVRNLYEKRLAGIEMVGGEKGK